MSKNKRNIDRDEKLNKLIENAHTQFLKNGYENTSMVSIAKASGVAPNTIYWYFKNKDELFASVFNKVVQDNFEKILHSSGTSLSDALQHFFKEWKKYRSWALTLHQRLGHSTALKDVHDNFHQVTEDFLLSLLLKKEVSQNLAEAIIRIVEYTFEGMLMHFEDDSTDQKAMQLAIQFITEQLIE